LNQVIHPGIFAVMEGTFPGYSPGPRAMRRYEKNIMQASSDQAAVGAVSAKHQGFVPLSIPFIRLAHDIDLGVGDPNQIKVAGYDISQESAWDFT
jgi:hypothetical protein